MVPARTYTGIQILSANLILERETDPVIWRGPIVAGVVKQFWSEALWEDVDYMFVDMPPGTGDVPLTVFQSLPVDGILIVTSPQELVSMIVGKAVNMAKKMDIPIIGLIENMSYLECPDCGKRISVFGESHIEDVAKEYGIPVLAQIPIDRRSPRPWTRGQRSISRRRGWMRRCGEWRRCKIHPHVSDSTVGGVGFCHFNGVSDFSILATRRSKSL